MSLYKRQMALSALIIRNVSVMWSCLRFAKSAVKCAITPSFKQISLVRHKVAMAQPNQQDFEAKLRELAPSLQSKSYKGQAGRIAIIGGSLEYTGAPYFSAISALRVGADLVHVFCPKDAGVVIKTYSPELIVHPILDAQYAVDAINEWLDRFHVVVIGPGLGREDKTFTVLEQVLKLCRQKSKPVIIDADGLFYISKNLNKLDDYPFPGVILTPNVMEFARILQSSDPKNIDESKLPQLFNSFGEHVTILLKGEQDRIITKHLEVKVPPGGSNRRCGGQGDILGGALATFLAWAINKKLSHTLACYAACKLTKECNKRVFKKKGRSMLASDMIEEIHGVFEDFFEEKK